MPKRRNVLITVILFVLLLVQSIWAEEETFCLVQKYIPGTKLTYEGKGKILVKMPSLSDKEKLEDTNVTIEFTLSQLTRKPDEEGNFFVDMTFKDFKLDITQNGKSFPLPPAVENIKNQDMAIKIKYNKENIPIAVVMPDGTTQSVPTTDVRNNPFNADLYNKDLKVGDSWGDNASLPMNSEFLKGALNYAQKYVIMDVTKILGYRCAKIKYGLVMAGSFTMGMYNGISGCVNFDIQGVGYVLYAIKEGFLVQTAVVADVVMDMKQSTSEMQDFHMELNMDFNFILKEKGK